MSSAWESLIDGARELDRGVPAETVLTELLAAWVDNERTRLGEDDDEAVACLPGKMTNA
jgi:hypothetical protein